VIVLVLGVATVAAFVRAGNDDGGSRLAQTGPGTTATTAAPATNEGSSGLGTGGAGQVAMGPTIPNTGIESALAPAVALLGAGVGLRMLVAGRRPHDA
jgi:hypothetical protein